MLKKLVVFACLISTPAIAGEENCRAIASFAATTMKAHQSGVALSDTQDAVKRIFPANVYKSLTILIVSIYRTPRYITPDAQERAIAEVRDEYYGECIINN